MKKTVRPAKLYEEIITPSDELSLHAIGNSSCHKFCANTLKNGADTIISRVSRRLSVEFGLKFDKPAAKPRLTSAMIKDEIIICQ